MHQSYTVAKAQTCPQHEFDDLQGGLVPAAQPEIGVYNGLFFEKFNTIVRQLSIHSFRASTTKKPALTHHQNTATGIIPGVVAKSPDNVAGLGLTQALTSVVQEFLGNALGFLNGAPPTITLFPYATIRALPGQSFDLSELYFGCKVNTVTPAASVGTQCVFTASGCNDKGQRVSEETFSFAPVRGGILRADMERKVFDGLKRMVNVTIALTAGGIGPVGAAVLMVDDVKTCVYKA
ncbi:hypothetical protein Slin14017_G036880 [Septoria linicola]|nr:hypothetical protein Slin14017_G036880 [Septoria linicola]